MKISNHKTFQEFAFLLGLSAMSAVTWTGLGQTYNYLFVALIIISIAIMRIGENHRIRFRGVHLLVLSTLIATIISSFFHLSNSSHVAYLTSKNLSGIFHVSSNDSSNEFYILFKWILSIYSLPTFVILVRRHSREKYAKILFWWTWSVLLSAIISILQSVGLLPVLPFIIQTGVESGRFAGLSNHPNSQAILLCLSLPIVLILFRMHLIKRWQFTLVVTLFEFAIFLTGSRNGIACSIIVILLIFSRRYESSSDSKLNVFRVFIIVVGIFIIFIVGIVDFAVQNSRLSLYSDTSGSDASSQGHFALMRYGFDITVNYPIFGIGPSVLKTFHNIYLQISGSFGLIGLLAFVIFIRNLFRIDFSKTLKFEYRLIAFTFLLFGMFNNNLADFYLYLPLGLCYASYSDEDYSQA